jgi:peptidylprolyl isomerase
MKPDARGRALRASGYLSVLVAALAVLVLAACGSKEVRVANEGDTVSVHYTGTLDDGEVFDSSDGRDPLTFTVGTNQVIQGFDDAVRGMAVGEKKKVRLEPGEAYGEHTDELLLEVPAANAPEGLAEGDLVQLSNGAPAKVVKVSDDTVTVDANHPLAGQPLTFEIELVGIE